MIDPLSFFDTAALMAQYPFLSYEVFGNTTLQYILAGAVFLGVYTLLKLFKRRVINNLDEMAERTANDVDDLVVEIIQSAGMLFYLFVSLGVAVQLLDQPPWLKTAISYAALGVVVYTVIRALQRVIQFIFTRAIKKRLQEDTQFDPSAIKLLSRVLGVAVWVFALLIIVQNEPFNYDITALVAGLGIGGIAIAFALQSILSDVFASFSIYFDKPFKTGDFIIVGETLGTVKNIGIQSTRIQSLWGEEITVPNKDLTSARIKNYKRLEQRRIEFSFGVKYDTPTAKLKKIPEIVQEILEGIETAELNRAHFKEFGDSSLNFEVMFTVHASDYNFFMDVRQEFNLKLKERLEKEKIEFAYPTQTVHIAK